MGDRGIAVLRFSDEYGADLAVYSHWTGSMLRGEVERIIKTPVFRARAGDESYAARILIDQLTKDARDQETGYGVFPFTRDRNPAGLSDGDVEVVVSMVTGAVSSS